MTILYTILLIIAAGTINRLRGWGDGWNGTKEPKWLVWAQKHIFSRPILTILQALLVGYYANLFGYSVETSIYIGLGMLLWFVGILKGWGEYFDFTRVDNDEIKWIDNLVIKLRNYLKTTKHKDLADSAMFVDSISFGLRGTYYLPMFIAIAAITQSWLALIPALAFWQDGLVYSYAKKNISGDYTAWAEKVGGGIRIGFIALALIIGL